MTVVITSKTKPIKYKYVAPLRDAILKQQGGKCILCLWPILEKDLTPALDHNHKTGKVRAVLCNNCNAQAGKIERCCIRAKRDGSPQEWLNRYLLYITSPETNIIHPTFGIAKRRAKSKAKKKRKFKKSNK